MTQYTTGYDGLSSNDTLTSNRWYRPTQQSPDTFLIAAAMSEHRKS